MPGKRGPEFYDNPSVFEFYNAKRSDPANANETLEKPVLDDLIGDMQGLRILDLGCGDARIGLEALQQGSSMYVGIEGSQNMARLARETLAGTKGIVHQSRIEDWSFPEKQFDLVLSRMVLHYLEDVGNIFQKVYRSLVCGGRFIFSIEHPVITSSDRAWRDGGPRQAWIVDNYFETGMRQTTWMGAEVSKYHRTIEDYFMGLREAGFWIDAVRESRPHTGMFSDPATYQRRKRIPLMLFFSAVRPDENRKKS
jgi:SAM-dependent methyltransferase